MGFFFWVFLGGILLYPPFFLILNVVPPSFSSVPAMLWMVVFFSGLFEVIYFTCLTMAYHVGELSLVYPISRSAPLFTQILAILVIGETLSPGGAGGVLLVLLGIFTIQWRDDPRTGKALPASRSLQPYLLALSAAIASSVYSVLDKIGVQILHPVFYLWLINLSMTFHTAVFLIIRGEGSLIQIWRDSKKEILTIILLQNAAYLLVLIAMQMSKVSYVVAFRQVGALFGAAMGIVFLKEKNGKNRLLGALILTLGLLLIGFSK
jgi:uncharacterized membrane protein